MIEDLLLCMNVSCVFKCISLFLHDYYLMCHKRIGIFFYRVLNCVEELKNKIRR